MLRATLKSMFSRKLRLILSMIAVVLGVMFVSGAFVLTDTLTRSFNQLFAGVFANTDVQVSKKPALNGEDFGGAGQVAESIPASVVTQVSGVDGVSSARGTVIAEGARMIGANGKVVASVGPPRFGVDWPSQAPDATIREGRGPTADSEIIVNAGLAKAGKVNVGDQVGVLTVFGDKQTFTLVGIFGYPDGQDSLGGSQIIAFTTPVAQKLMLGATDVYSVIDVKTAGGISDEELRDRVAATLGTAYEVKTGQQLSDDAAAAITDALKFFNYILLGFAGVSLFVGAFLILNTFSIIVAQRTRELALMRAIGASRRQVIKSVLTEASLIGVVASVIGLGAGIGVGALLAVFFGTFTSGSLQLAGVGVPAAAVIGAFAVGIGMTVIAALFPALRAARIPPVAALRESATADRPLTRVTVAGGSILAVGAVLLALGLTDNAGDQPLWSILIGVLVAFIGVALLSPLLARPVSAVVGRLFSWSVPGKLGRLNSGRNPRRTAITAAALMVGIALITGINTVVASVKQSITQTVNEQAHVDLIVSGEYGPSGPPTFDPKVLDESAKISGVKAVAGMYQDFATIDGKPGFVAAMTNLASLPEMFSLRAASGSIDSINDGQLILDEPTATDKNLQVGSPVTVQLPRGAPLTLTVSGIYAKSDLVQGYLIPLSAVKEFRTAKPTNAFIQVAPGASTDNIKSQVERLLADSPEVTVGDRTEYLDQQTKSLDQVLNMIQILLILAIVIAVLGVINTLALSVLERTREIGLLRAIGLNRIQTTRMVAVEAIVISLFGALLGIGVGIGLGASVVQALHDQGITQFALPWSQMTVYLISAAFVGVFAAILPAIRAVRVNVLTAIAYE